MTREAPNQADIRDHYAALGVRLWRNNVGAMTTPDGRLVRFGLANDSKAVNQTLKSGDLIGWRPLLVTSDMVGSNVAEFWSIECKRDGWTFNPADAAQAAQLRWARMVRREGGVAGFMHTPGQMILP